MDVQTMDVVSDPAGFLIVQIDDFGYIKREGNLTVHRETRDMHECLSCVRTFSEAKKRLPVSEDVCLLELTSEGGGARIWMREEQRETLVPRLQRFKGCYGMWPVETLTGI